MADYWATLDARVQRFEREEATLLEVRKLRGELERMQEGGEPTDQQRLESLWLAARSMASTPAEGQRGQLLRVMALALDWAGALERRAS